MGQNGGILIFVMFLATGTLKMYVLVSHDFSYVYVFCGVDLEAVQSVTI